MTWYALLGLTLLTIIGSASLHDGVLPASLGAALLWAGGALLAVAAYSGICRERRQKHATICAPESPLPCASQSAAVEWPVSGHRHPLYRTARIGLFLLSAGLLASSLGGIARSLDHILYAGALQLPPSDQKLEKTITAELAKAVTTLNFDSIILEALAEEDIHRAEIYVTVARRIGFPLRPQTLAEFEDATDIWSTGVRKTISAGGGFLTGGVEDLESFAGAVVGDISGWGDLRDITIHGSACLAGKPYDAFILGLSLFGFAITVLEPSQVMNTGAAVLKGANRFRRTSQPLRRQLHRMVGETVDMDAAKAAMRNPTAENAAKAIRREGAGALTRVAAHAGTIYDTGGSRALLMALRHADNTDELALFARVSRVMGKQADEVIELAGKRLKTVLRAHKITLRTAAMVTGWTGALLAALLTLSAALSERVARRIGTTHLLAWLARSLTVRA